MRLADILTLPQVWRRLMGDRLTRRGLRRLTETMAARKQRFERADHLTRQPDATEFYGPPIDPKERQ